MCDSSFSKQVPTMTIVCRDRDGLNLESVPRRCHLSPGWPMHFATNQTKDCEGLAAIGEFMSRHFASFAQILDFCCAYLGMWLVYDIIIRA